MRSKLKIIAALWAALITSTIACENSESKQRIQQQKPLQTDLGATLIWHTTPIKRAEPLEDAVTMAYHDIRTNRGGKHLEGEFGLVKDAQGLHFRLKEEGEDIQFAIQETGIKDSPIPIAPLGDARQIFSGDADQEPTRFPYVMNSGLRFYSLTIEYAFFDTTTPSNSLVILNITDHARDPDTGNLKSYSVQATQISSGGEKISYSFDTFIPDVPEIRYKLIIPAGTTDPRTINLQCSACGGEVDSNNDGTMGGAGYDSSLPKISGRPPPGYEDKIKVIGTIADGSITVDFDHDKRYAALIDPATGPQQLTSIREPALIGDLEYTLALEGTKEGTFLLRFDATGQDIIAEVYQKTATGTIAIALPNQSQNPQRVSVGAVDIIYQQVGTNPKDIEVLIQQN